MQVWHNFICPIFFDFYVNVQKPRTGDSIQSMSSLIFPYTDKLFALSCNYLLTTFSRISARLLGTSLSRLTFFPVSQTRPDVGQNDGGQTRRGQGLGQPRQHAQGDGQVRRGRHLLSQASRNLPRTRRSHRYRKGSLQPRERLPR